MKNNRNRLFAILLGFTFIVFSACQPEEYSLGEMISVGELDYEIRIIEEDPNRVVLESRNAGMTPIWIHPNGRSTKSIDTIFISTKGEHEIIYGVLSPGGLVQAEPQVITIEHDDLTPYDHWMSDLLVGGLGSEKTWVLDIDDNGNSMHFKGPMYFSCASIMWTTLPRGEDDNLYEFDENYIYAHGDPVTPDDIWFWEAGYQGWATDPEKHGSLTFSLKQTAELTVEYLWIPAQFDDDGTIFYTEEWKTIQKGTFDIDTVNKLLLLDDVAPLFTLRANIGTMGRYPREMKFVTLTDSTMQIAAYEIKSLADPDWNDEVMIFNYLSEEYAERLGY